MVQWLADLFTEAASPKDCMEAMCSGTVMGRFSDNHELIFRMIYPLISGQTATKYSNDCLCGGVRSGTHINIIYF